MILTLPNTNYFRALVKELQQTKGFLLPIAAFEIFIVHFELHDFHK